MTKSSISFWVPGPSLLQLSASFEYLMVHNLDIVIAVPLRRAPPTAYSRILDSKRDKSASCMLIDAVQWTI